MGDLLNESNDAISFYDFYEKWGDTFFSSEKSPLGPEKTNVMVEDLKSRIIQHCSTAQGDKTRWGWKNPRSMLVLPFIHAVLPDMKFLHVVRDGRDMAFSGNQMQIIKHGPAFFETKDLELTPEKSLIFWDKTNMFAAHYAEEHMQDNYLRVRFEDLCDFLPAVTTQLSEFLSVEHDDLLTILKNSVKRPASIGRWKKQAEKTMKLMLNTDCSGLKYFGYFD